MALHDHLDREHLAEHLGGEHPGGWAAGGQALAGIRTWVGVNLLLGLAIIAITVLLV